MSIWNVTKPDQPAPAPPSVPEAEIETETGPVLTAEEARNLRLKISIHRSLLDKINLAALDQLSREQIRAQLIDIVAELLETDGEPLLGVDGDAVDDAD